SDPGIEQVASGDRFQLLAARDSRSRYLGGFTFVLEDRAGNDVQFLAKNLGTFLEAARKRPEIAGLSTTFLPSVPQQFVEVNRDKVLKQGVPLNDVYRTIQAFMGGYFIN